MKRSARFLVLAGAFLLLSCGVSIGTVSAYNPATVASNPDVNLEIRGWKDIVGPKLGLIDLPGPEPDSLAPRLNTLVRNNLRPDIRSLYQVYDWNWATNSRGAPITGPFQEVTLVGFAPTSGTVIQVPVAGRKIGGDAQVMVLYADSDSITLKYTSEDTVATGYTIHIQNISVAGAIITKYNELNAAGRATLPTLKACQEVGRSKGTDVLTAIRDTGSFMDPRSKRDWWNDKGCDQTFSTDSPSDIGEIITKPGFDPLTLDLVSCPDDNVTVHQSYPAPSERPVTYGVAGTGGGGIQSNRNCVEDDENVPAGCRSADKVCTSGCEGLEERAWCDQGQCSGRGHRCGICVYGEEKNVFIQYLGSGCPEGFNPDGCTLVLGWGQALPPLKAGQYKVTSGGFCPGYQDETVTVSEGCTITGSLGCKGGAAGLSQSCSSVSDRARRFGMPSPAPPANKDTAQTYARPIGGKWCTQEVSTPLDVVETYKYRADYPQQCINGQWAAKLRLQPDSVQVPFAQDTGQYLVGILDYEHFSPAEISERYDRVMGLPLVNKSMGVGAIWDLGGPINRLAPQLEQDKLKHLFLTWLCEKSGADPMQGRNVQDPKKNTRYPETYYIEAPIFGSQIVGDVAIRWCKNFPHPGIPDDLWNAFCDGFAAYYSGSLINVKICEVYNNTAGWSFPIPGSPELKIGDVYQKKMNSLGLWPPPIEYPTIPTKGPIYIPNVAEQAVWDRIPLFANEESKGQVEFLMCGATEKTQIETSVPQVYRVAKASRYLQWMLLAEKDSEKAREDLNALDASGGWQDENESFGGGGEGSSGVGTKPMVGPYIAENEKLTDWGAAPPRRSLSTGGSYTSKVSNLVQSKVEEVKANIRGRFLAIGQQFRVWQTGIVYRLASIIPPWLGVPIPPAPICGRDLPTCKDEFNCPKCDSAQLGPPDTEVFVDYQKPYTDSTRGEFNLYPDSSRARSFLNDCYPDWDSDSKPWCYDLTITRESTHWCDGWENFPDGYRPECYKNVPAKAQIWFSYPPLSANFILCLNASNAGHVLDAQYEGICWVWGTQRVASGFCDVDLNTIDPKSPKRVCYQEVKHKIPKWFTRTFESYVGVWNVVPYLLPSWSQLAGTYGVLNIQRPYRPAVEPSASESAGLFWPKGKPFDAQNLFADTPGGDQVEYTVVSKSEVDLGLLKVTVDLKRDPWKLIFYNLAGVWNAKNWVVQEQAP
jgi:hypothetical protein